MKSEEITDVNKCVGCGLCADLCPKQCISMAESPEGFKYPQINESECIDCKLCQRSCPVNHTIRNLADFEKEASLAINLEDDIYSKSSSGGIFYLLGRQVIDHGGCVFGAAWDENLHLHHICAESEAELQTLLRSKYVQSDTSGIWNRLKAEVATGRQVLFSGTPCHIGAARALFSRGVPENLLLVEVICMGVPSPGLFYDYVADIQRKKNLKLSEIRFRDKTHFGSVRSHSLILRSDCGVAYARVRHLDPFFRQFLDCNILRKSCYQCSFKSTERAADITLGDCWGMTAKAVEAFGRSVVSLIMVNTTKGSKAMTNIDSDIKSSPVEMADVFKCQKMLTVSCPEGPLRKSVFVNVPKGRGIYNYLKKVSQITWKDALKSKLIHILYRNR